MSTDGSKRKQLTGIVVATSTAKTIVVTVERRAPDARYGKMVRSVKKYHAHDEKGEAKVGDTVRIEECKPISKTKRWRLVAMVRRGSAVANEATV